MNDTSVIAGRDTRAPTRRPRVWLRASLVLLFLVCVIADNALPLAPIHVILLECFMVREGNR